MEIAIVVVIVFVVYLATITQAEKKEFNKGIDKQLASEKERWYTAIEKAEAAKDKDKFKNFECPSCGAVEEVVVPLTTEFFWPKS